MRNTLKLVLILTLIFVGAAFAHADEAVVEQQLVLSNHNFTPAVLMVPAEKKIKITIVNKDATGAEFESDDLGREKVVPPNGQIYVYVGPLDPGTYAFYDDFHKSLATGKIIAK